jgi:hypothetical protein
MDHGAAKWGATICLRKRGDTGFFFRDQVLGKICDEKRSSSPMCRIRGAKRRF